MIQNLINHVGICIDGSGSMQIHTNKVIDVVDGIIRKLAKDTQANKQETRISIWIFNSKVECLVFEMDVMRFDSLKSYYRPVGGTAFIDATVKTIDDLNLIPTMYGDHAFIAYTITDGEENDSRHYTASDLTKKIAKLPPEWTFVAFVPDERGVAEAKRFGFPAGNISKWDTTTVNGVTDLGKVVTASLDNYMILRSKGVRGTTSLLEVSTTNLKTKDVKDLLAELRPSDYRIYPVNRTSQIRPYVEAVTGDIYRLGASYYQLSKTETIQGGKQIIIKNRTTGKVYAGTPARNLLGIPNYDVKVRPADYGDWIIFVQSTSVNRNLIPGTEVLVIK